MRVIIAYGYIYFLVQVIVYCLVSYGMACVQLITQSVANLLPICFTCVLETATFFFLLLLHDSVCLGQAGLGAGCLNACWQSHDLLSFLNFPSCCRTVNCLYV